MLKNKWIPLADIDDKMEIWKGNRFRQYNVGLNVTDKKQDYYEYMLTEIPGEKQFMLLTCVEGYKAGSALTYVKTVKDVNKFIIEGSEIKLSMGINDTYILTNNV